MPVGFADDLIAQAASERDAEISLPQFAESHLRRLAASFERASPSPVADLSFRAGVVRRLGAFTRLAGERPSGAAGSATVVTGLPRTGSTLLHTLLSCPPDARFLPHYLVMSGSAAELSDINARRRDAWDRLELLDMLDLRVRDAHPMAVDWPDECTLLFEYTFQSYQFPAAYGLPGYLQWLLDSDWTDSYDWYARHLGAFLSPGSDDASAVLKSPFHVLHLDQVRRVLPEYEVVLTVRRAIDVTRSWLRLVGVTHQALFGGPLPAEVHGLWLEVLGRMAEASVHASRCDGVKVIHYEDLVADPIGVAVGLAAPSEADLGPIAAAMRKWTQQPEALRRSNVVLEALSLRDLPPIVADRFAEYDRHFGYA